MFHRLFGPASGRKFATFDAHNIAALVLVALVYSTPFCARAHEGHDDVSPAAGATPNVPRLATRSEIYELVATLKGERLTIYLDRFEDNSPVTDANITVLVDGQPVAAQPVPDGSYIANSQSLVAPGSIELVFDIRAPAADDLLIGKLFLPNAAASTEGASVEDAPSGRLWSALRHGAQDHLTLLVLALCAGLGLGLACSRLRLRALPIVLLVPALFPIATRVADAHEGHDQAADGAPAAPASDVAQRLPSGQVFVPKPTQRILDIRTTTAKTVAQAKAILLVGRVIADPNRSGLVQSISGGRVTAPDRGFPRLGQKVATGQVLASVEPPMKIADRTTISERLGELEQLIAVAETKLKRLRPLAERNAVPQSQVIDAETELEGLYRRRDVLRQTRVAPEILRAPIDGVVAISRVVSGQVVQAEDVLFQIIDPNDLWVEAYEYGDTNPEALEQATAIGPGNNALKLTFQGWSRALQHQATVVQFAVSDPPPSIRVGQPVTVTAQTTQTVTGVIISREAIVHSANGETIVWRHVEPELFEARPVRTEPFDASQVTIAAGVADGDRIVTRGAELINQIH